MKARKFGVSFGKTHLHPAIAAELWSSVAQDLTTAQILRNNRQWLQEMHADGYERLEGVLYRIALNASDVATVRKSAHKAGGLNTRGNASANLHEMITDVSKGEYKDVREAVAFYKRAADAHMEADSLGDKDRLEMVIATPHMVERARQLAHESMIFMDGTFGISTARLLVFVVMALDEDTRMGIPVAFLIFSASSYARSTAASYDDAII